MSLVDGEIIEGFFMISEVGFFFFAAIEIVVVGSRVGAAKNGEKLTSNW